MPTQVPKDTSRYRQYLNAELEGAGLYATLADAMKDEERSQVFRQLAGNEMRHAARWAEKLHIPPDDLKPVITMRTRFLGWLVRRFGLRAVAPFLLAGEFEEFNNYMSEPQSDDLARDERIAARVLAVAGGDSPRFLRHERWHRSSGGGSLRAAVLGVNDGLVSNLSLTMGVAGGVQDPHIILLAGVAGLLAGSFSMAAGEYVSMSAQRELYEHQIKLERTELDEMPDEEIEELELIYRAKGMDATVASRLARHVMSDPEMAVRTKVVEELGLSPDDLGSPWGAAFSSLAAFAIGALVPVSPYFFAGGMTALLFSAALSGLMLALVGAVLAAVSGRDALRGALRMVGVGVAASAVTYAVGKLFGVALS